MVSSEKNRQRLRYRVAGVEADVQAMRIDPPRSSAQPHRDRRGHGRQQLALNLPRRGRAAHAADIDAADRDTTCDLLAARRGHEKVTFADFTAASAASIIATRPRHSISPNASRSICYLLLRR